MYLAAASLHLGTVNAQPAQIACKAEIQAEPFKGGTIKLKDGIYKKTQDLNYCYLLNFNTFQLLYNFRANAGLPNTVKPLGGWESPWCELRGHFTGHFLSSLGLMYSATGDEQLKLKAKRSRNRSDYCGEETIQLCNSKIV